MTTIVTRAGKGSPLTHAEVDTNFTNLNTAKLEAGAIALGSAALPSISFTGDTNTGIFSPGADQVAISTNSTGRLTIDSSGNVNIDSGTVYVDAANNRLGVGTTTPDAIFGVGNTQNGIRLHYDRLAYNNIFGGFDHTGDYGGFGIYNVNGSVNQSIRFLRGSSYAGLSESARFDSSGRLLVGTTSGTGDALLGIQGRISDSARGGILQLRRGQAASSLSTGDDIGAIRFSDNTSGNTGFAEILCASDGASAANNYPGRLVFSTTADGASSPTERLRIDNAGNLYLNTQSVIDVSMFSAVIKTGLNFATIKAPDTITYMAFQFQNSSGSRVGYIQFTTTNVIYSTSSDYRLKENVTAVTDGIARLQQLKPIRFNFIADPNKTFDGFFAHEVQTIVPEAISGEKDAVDDDNNPIYQGIDQSKLVPLLTAALQEAVTKIESLEARLTAAGI